jgi:hypothetical protein
MVKTGAFIVDAPKTTPRKVGESVQKGPEHYLTRRVNQDLLTRPKYIDNALIGPCFDRYHRLVRHIAEAPAKSISSTLPDRCPAKHRVGAKNPDALAR